MRISMTNVLEALEQAMVESPTTRPNGSFNALANLDIKRTQPIMETALAVSMPMIEYFEPVKVRVKQDATPELEFGQQESGLDEPQRDVIKSTYLVNGRA